MNRKDVWLGALFVMLSLGYLTLGFMREVRADDRDRTVVLEAGSVTTEVCVLVVHRSRMHGQHPVARCATPAELKELLK